jgi:transposase-like protein
VNADGCREILGIDVTSSEDGAYPILGAQRERSAARIYCQMRLA